MLISTQPPGAPGACQPAYRIAHFDVVPAFTRSRQSIGEHLLVDDLNTMNVVQSEGG